MEFFRCGLPEVGDGPSSRGGYMMMNFDTSAQMHMGSRSGPSAGRNQQFASTVRPLLLAPAVAFMVRFGSCSKVKLQGKWLALGVVNESERACVSV